MIRVLALLADIVGLLIFATPLAVALVYIANAILHLRRWRG